MSIWCSWPSIGHNDDGDPKRGEVLSYAEGWSNHFPTLDGSAELPASVDLAHVAPWCVPGHDECGSCDQAEHVGPWLRLTVFAEQALSFWTDPPTASTVHASVSMDRAAVEALVSDLTAWLAYEHVEAVNS